MRALILFALLFCFLIACSVVPPERNFKTTLYEIDWEARCIYYLNDEGDVTIICGSDIDKNIIGVHVDDYGKERQYQELLKKSCSQWR